jgi:hypothetical protein
MANVACVLAVVRIIMVTGAGGVWREGNKSEQISVPPTSF